MHILWCEIRFLVVPKTACVFLSLNLCSCCSLCLEGSPLTPTGEWVSLPHFLQVWANVISLSFFQTTRSKEKALFHTPKLCFPCLFSAFPHWMEAPGEWGGFFCFLLLMFCFLHYPWFWEPRLGNWRCLNVGRMKGLYLRYHLSLGAP